MLSHVAAIVLAVGPLQLPYECGESFPVTQGNGGQFSHTGFAQYAWDFGMPVNTPVLATAAGTVGRIRMDSNTGGCDASFANDGNYVVIDHGDGESSLFLHLAQNSSDLQLGDPVVAGDVVGTIGLTGWVCGAHLHFQVQGLCNSWWCQSVPSSFDSYGVPVLGDDLESLNCGEPMACEAVLDGGVTEVSEEDPGCFSRTSQFWWDSDAGLGGHHYYTFATDLPDADSVGTWHVSVDVAGAYELSVYVPSSDAETQQATYTIHHADGQSQVMVDQASESGWVSLGTFEFDLGTDARVVLPDNTGENYGQLMRPIAYDSIRFTYLDDETGEGGEEAGEAGEAGDGGDGGGTADTGEEGGTVDTGDGTTVGDSGEEGTGSDGGFDSGGSGPGLGDRGAEGCSCSASDPGKPACALWLLGLAGLLGFRRRR